MSTGKGTEWFPTSGESWQVDVPGGRLTVDLPEHAGDSAWLTGPGVIVAHGEVLLP